MIVPLPAPVLDPAGSGSGSPSGCPSVYGRPCSVSSQTASARWLGAFTCQRSDVSRAGPGWAGEGSVPMVPRGASLEIRGTTARVAGSLGAARTCVMLGGRGSWGTLAQRSDLSQPSRPHVPVGRLCSLTRNTSCRTSTLSRESADLFLTYSHTQTYHYSVLDSICPLFSHSLGRLLKCAEVVGTLSLVFPSSACATSSAFGVPQCRGSLQRPYRCAEVTDWSKQATSTPLFTTTASKYTRTHTHTHIA